jgi:hypothetical protein
MMDLLSLVIFFSSEVWVKNRLNGLCDLLWEQVLSVKTGFEDRLDTFVRVAFDLEGEGAGCLEAFRGVGFSQS